MNDDPRTTPGALCDCTALAYRRPDGAPSRVKVEAHHPGACVIVNDIDSGRSFPVAKQDLIPWSDARVIAWNERGA